MDTNKKDTAWSEKFNLFEIARLDFSRVHHTAKKEARSTRAMLDREEERMVDPHFGRLVLRNHPESEWK